MKITVTHFFELDRVRVETTSGNDRLSVSTCESYELDVIIQAIATSIDQRMHNERVSLKYLDNDTTESDDAYEKG